MFAVIPVLSSLGDWSPSIVSIYTVYVRESPSGSDPCSQERSTDVVDDWKATPLLGESKATGKGA